MSLNIVALGASNSSTSINKKLAHHAAYQIEGADLNLLDLNDFEMPLYGIDLEKKEGIPQLAHDFKAHLAKTDGIIISFAEHNGAYSVAFKNVFDWISRIDSDVWYNKPMLLMATSPGGRGGQTVLDIAANKFKYMTKNKIFTFSLPSFFDNYSDEKGVVDDALKSQLSDQITQFIDVMNDK